MNKRNLIFLVLISLMCGLGQLGHATNGNDALMKALRKAIPGMTPDRIVESVIPDLYEVSYGPEIFYVSKDGHYVLQGDLVNLETRENLTESRRAAGRRTLLENLPSKDMIVFAPEAKRLKHTVTVFTDVDCAYCRKLHSEITEYNKLGIAIRYLAFPRSGVDTESYYKAVSVWCSPDRRDALTRAKRGDRVEHRNCNNPVRDEMALGDRLGVNGTPTMILEDGTLVAGYLPPDRLSEVLDHLAEVRPQASSIR